MTLDLNSGFMKIVLKINASTMTKLSCLKTKVAWKAKLLENMVGLKVVTPQNMLPLKVLYNNPAFKPIFDIACSRIKVNVSVDVMTDVSFNDWRQF